MGILLLRYIVNQAPRNHKIFLCMERRGARLLGRTIEVSFLLTRRSLCSDFCEFLPHHGLENFKLTLKEFQAK